MKQIEFRCLIRRDDNEYECFTVTLVLPEWAANDIEDDIRKIIVRQVLENDPLVSREDDVDVYAEDELQPEMDD